MFVKETGLADLKTVSLVCPFYNEESSVAPFFERLYAALGGLRENIEIVCVNDGSSDRTLQRLVEAKAAHPEIRIINLSRNFGKEAALTAGLDFSTGDAVVPLDADLQDPPELIIDMVAKWREGYDVVLARRADRKSDAFAKRLSAELFYKLHNRISHTRIPENVGDFRLMSRRVVESVKCIGETQRFMKGIFAWVGYSTATLEYVRQERVAGRSKFSFWRLWNFALDGITGFSTAPLRVWLYLGLVISLFAFMYGGFIIFKTLFFGIEVPGYASILTSILFFGGVQLISIGILGEYIGRLYLEAKARPVYIVESEI
ncbi:MAG: glycosyltransferase family 2 protein [Gammaproteobacteria bacterium]